MRRLEYLIYDRTSWSRRFGFNIYPNAHPHNEHIHIEITRSAAADMTDLFYQISAAERDQYFAPTVAAYPPMTMPSAVVANGRRLQAGGGGAVEVASFELVRRKTTCNYDKGSTYLGAFHQTCTEENGNCLLQEGYGGLQACANLCARTADCVVFGWQNYKDEYPGAPELANYDLRSCYQINVRSSAECGTSRGDMAVTDLDVYSLTGVNGGLEVEEAEEAYAAQEEGPPDGKIISLQATNAHFATAANGDLITFYEGSAASSSGAPESAAPFQLVRRKTTCNYDKGSTYLGAFHQTCTEENGNCLLQEGYGGLQACANLCARTADCVVFGWQNYKDEYPGAPELANYDLRSCYQINVRSSAECGTSRGDMAVTDLDVYSLFSETDSLKLVFDLSIKVTGAVSCPGGRGWDGTVELPLTASSVELSIVPASPLADAPINPAAVPWLAKATADALRLGEGGELKISPVLARPFALVESGARCSTGSVWLGDLPTAQLCAEMCASINQKPGVVSGSLAKCEFFAWRPPGSPGTAVSGMSGSFSNRELDGCFMQQTATKACAEGWDRTAVGVTFNFYEMLDSVTTGSTKAARWWASYEQLRLNSEVVQAMAGDAEGMT